MGCSTVWTLDFSKTCPMEISNASFQQMCAQYFQILPRQGDIIFLPKPSLGKNIGRDNTSAICADTANLLTSQQFQQKL